MCWRHGLYGRMHFFVPTSTGRGGLRGTLRRINTGHLVKIFEKCIFLSWLLATPSALLIPAWISAQWYFTMKGSFCSKNVLQDGWNSFLQSVPCCREKNSLGPPYSNNFRGMGGPFVLLGSGLGKSWVLFLVLERFQSPLNVAKGILWPQTHLYEKAEKSPSLKSEILLALSVSPPYGYVSPLCGRYYVISTNS